jgi:hypothetical protein
VKFTTSLNELIIHLVNSYLHYFSKNKLYSNSFKEPIDNKEPELDFERQLNGEKKFGFLDITSIVTLLDGVSCQKDLSEFQKDLNASIKVAELKERYKADNIILLTLRRMDLLKFIKEQYIQSKKPIRITYEDTFKIRIKGKIQELSVKDKIFSTLSNLDGAIKIGYLQKMNQLIFKTFNEKLVALTSIGLIVFNDPHKPPERLYPIIGSQIIKPPYNKYKRHNCFEILTQSGDVKVFSAYKERELNSWVEELEKVKRDFKQKMVQLDTKNKFELTNDKNNLFNIKEEDEEE